MQKILCATRGGIASQVTRKAAVALARTTGFPLIYLYVVNTEFMERTTDLAHIPDAARELTRLGEFILAVAVERAEDEGVAAEGIVRHGKWQDVLMAVAVETRPRYVILGSPALDSPQYPDAIHQLRQYASAIQSASGAEVVIVLPSGECTRL